MSECLWLKNQISSIRKQRSFSFESVLMKVVVLWVPLETLVSTETVIRLFGQVKPERREYGGLS